MSRGNLRQPNMVYDPTSRQHHPYPQIAPTHNTIPHLALPDLCDDSLDKDLCYSDCPPHSSQGKLTGTLYTGSASFTDYILPHLNRTPSRQYSSSSRMETNRNNHSPIQSHWDPSIAQPLAPMPTPLAHSSSQSSFSSISNKELNGGTGSRTKSMKRSQGSSPKRPTLDDFRSLVLRSLDYEALIYDYVGTDARYTLAKNHSGMMVRLSIKSQEMSSRMREVFEPLDSIDIFLGFLLEHQGMKQEQKGCVALRICMGALTALMGDFNQANGVENFVSDPHAAVVPREYLGRFRSFNSNLYEILRRLSAKLEKSMNLYRHRRSPSISLVAKFQEMSDTLEVWNKHLADDTFLPPFRIASEWLKNHPAQVDSRRRNQAFSEQASPSLSDTTGPSPIQCDSNYLSPVSQYGESSLSPNRSAMRPAAMDGGQIQYDSLFRPSPSAAGVTYYSSNGIPASSMAFNPNLYRTTGGLEGCLNLPSMTGGLEGFAHQSHSNTGQYQGTNPGYPPY
ncbi:unnamed protein product [Rhizoctonia solani]|uniref:Uncharacterized protein n=1 Tax=Rhizoctonia solani TaxID=456999 RepID=A0A8H3HSN5_9AGAM|nr:unnamed protein product [Rhizoctonia solani]CAE6535862.1 unnamed protein product [Rhizoctonia solani]